MWLFLVFLSVQRFRSHPVRAHITNRVRTRLAADIANLFCVFGAVSRLLDVCHFEYPFSTGDGDFVSAYGQDRAVGVCNNFVSSVAFEMRGGTQMARCAANAQYN
jgi:hypothetical protein